MDIETLQTLSKDQLIGLLMPFQEKQEKLKKKTESEEHKRYRQIKNREYYQRKKLKELINT